MTEQVRKVLTSSERKDWETPMALFEELNKEFHFTLDAAASNSNHKCERYYTEETNGLEQDWSNEIVFVNPPYGHSLIEPWVKKAVDEVLNNGAVVVMLLPARTGTKWFHHYIYNNFICETRFLKGRLKFEINGMASQPATFDSMVCVFRKGGENAVS